MNEWNNFFFPWEHSRLGWNGAQEELPCGPMLFSCIVGNVGSCGLGAYLWAFSPSLFICLPLCPNSVWKNEETGQKNLLSGGGGGGLVEVHDGASSQPPAERGGMQSAGWTPEGGVYLWVAEPPEEAASCHWQGESCYSRRGHMTK